MLFLLATKGQTINLLAYQRDNLNNMHAVGRFQNITNNFSDSLGALSPKTNFHNFKRYLLFLRGLGFIGFRKSKNSSF